MIAYLLWALVIASGGLVLVVGGMLLHAIWTDQEEAKAERAQMRRIELEGCLRSSPPRVVSFRDKASKGFQR